MNKPGATQPRQKGRNQSLARGLAILEMISREGSGQGVRELSRKLKLNKSIVHRLILTLADHGFLERDPETAKYRVGLRAFEVGQVYVTAGGLQEAALPQLRSLAHEHHLNAILGVREGDKVVYLLTVQSSADVVLRSRPAARSPLHATAVGKVLLAGEQEGALNEILGSEPLARYTEKTIVDPAELRKQLEEVRLQGYAISDEEYYSGVLAVGAPVYDQNGDIIAAVSGGIPRYLVREDQIPEIIRLVTTTAFHVSRRLGANRAIRGQS